MLRMCRDELMSWLSHEGDGCWQDREQFTETRACRRLCEEPRGQVEEAGAGVPGGRQVGDTVLFSSWRSFVTFLQQRL